MSHQVLHAVVHYFFVFLFEEIIIYFLLLLLQSQRLIVSLEIIPLYFFFCHFSIATTFQQTVLDVYHNRCQTFWKNMQIFPRDLLQVPLGKDRTVVAFTIRQVPFAVWSLNMYGRVSCVPFFPAFLPSRVREVGCVKYDAFFSFSPFFLRATQLDTPVLFQRTYFSSFTTTGFFGSLFHNRNLRVLLFPAENGFSFFLFLLLLKGKIVAIECFRVPSYD